MSRFERTHASENEVQTLRLWKIISILLLYFHSTNGQQPGGVNGTIQWYKSELVPGRRTSGQVLGDLSGHKRPDLATSTTDISFNFHTSVFLDSRSSKKVSLENLAYSHATVFAVLYPEQPASGSNQLLFSYNSTRETLEYPPGSRNDKSMKVISQYWSTPKLFLNVWGDEKLSTIETNFGGFIPELILYNRVLTPLERVQVESYLAIKYALTFDQTYVDDSGKALWDPLSPLIGSYNNRVCAIGKHGAMSIFQPVATTSNEPLFDGRYAYENTSHGEPENKNLVPFGDSISTRRSITIGFMDKTLSKLPDKSLLFWGDDNKSQALNGAPADPDSFPNLFLAERKWMIWNPSIAKNSLTFSVSGALQGELYDAYDYHFNRFVMVVYSKDQKKIEKTLLFSHLGRLKFLDESRGRMDFHNNRIVWENISFFDSTGKDSFNFVGFGKVPLMRIFQIDGKPVAGVKVEENKPISSIIKTKPYPRKFAASETNVQEVDIPISFTQGVEPYYFRLFKKLDSGADSLVSESRLPKNAGPAAQTGDDIADDQDIITEQQTVQRPAPSAKRRKVTYYKYTIPKLRRKSNYLVRIQDKVGQLAEIEINVN